MAKKRGVIVVETPLDPSRYSRAQIRRALNIAAALDRGKLVLLEPPDGRSA